MIGCLLLGLSHVAFAQEPIRFVVPDFAPYTFEANGKLQGIGIELVTKILDEAGLQYSIALVPNYGRAVKDVNYGDADGFFLASQNAERDEIAVMSNAVMINKWCWFFPVESHLDPLDPNFKTNVLVGTHLNTNTQKWLEKNGYKVVPAVKVELLPKLLLELKRIEAVFLAELVFIDAAERNGIPADRYRKMGQVEQPFAIYLAKAYVVKHPDVMERINAAIEHVITP